LRASSSGVKNERRTKWGSVAIEGSRQEWAGRRGESFSNDVARKPSRKNSQKKKGEKRGPRSYLMRKKDRFAPPLERRRC